MSRICPVTGRGRHKAHNVSHANNKTRKWQLPNLRIKRFWNEQTGQWVRLRLSARGIKTITKNGLASILRDFE